MFSEHAYYAQETQQLELRNYWLPKSDHLGMESQCVAWDAAVWDRDLRAHMTPYYTELDCKGQLRSVLCTQAGSGHQDLHQSSTSAATGGALTF